MFRLGVTKYALAPSRYGCGLTATGPVCCGGGLGAGGFTTTVRVWVRTRMRWCECFRWWRTATLGDDDGILGATDVDVVAVAATGWLLPLWWLVTKITPTTTAM